MANVTTYLARATHNRCKRVLRRWTADEMIMASATVALAIREGRSRPWVLGTVKHELPWRSGRSIGAKADRLYEALAGDGGFPRFRVVQVERLPGETEAQFRTRYGHIWYRQQRSAIRNRQLQKRYGITLSDYDTLLRRQRHLCAICRRRSVTSLGVDHDHRTGRIRGLLCGQCNQALGLLSDDFRTVARAFRYMRAEREQHEWLGL